MDPMLIGAALFLGSKLMKGKKDSTTSNTVPGSSGSDVSTKPNLTGAPTLKIDKIHKFPIDKVDFILEAEGQTMKADHKPKETSPTTIKAGQYIATAISDPNPRPGQKKPDVVMIVVRDKNNKTIIAKRILINDKKIIDVI